MTLLTPQETAERIHMSVSWLAEQRRLGRGPAFIRLGGIGRRRGKIRYRPEDLDAYLLNCREENSCHSTNTRNQNIGGADSRSPEKRFGGQLAREVAERLRGKSGSLEPTLRSKHPHPDEQAAK